MNWLYRRLFCRGGHGVHSPFVFDLITTVIEEKSHYYCYDQLHRLRRQLLHSKEKIALNNHRFSISKLLKKNGFRESEDRLLFRLANRFQPKQILVIGSDFGLTPLYLTAFSKDAACTVVEQEPSITAITQDFLKSHAVSAIDLSDSLDNIPNKLDMIVWGSSFQFSVFSFQRSMVKVPPFKGVGGCSCQLSVFSFQFSMQSFERLLTHIHDLSVMVISGINATSENRAMWKMICAHPKVTVTIDLCRLGIVFFNPKLHRKIYKSIVLM